MVWPGVNATFFSAHFPNPHLVAEMSLLYVSIIRQVGNIMYISFNLLVGVCVDFVTDFAYEHLRLQMTINAHSLRDACATNRRKEGLWYWPLDPNDSSSHYFASLNSEEWVNFIRLVYSEIHFSRNCFNSDVILFLFATHLRHLHPIFKIDNCDSNSRLVVNEDANGKVWVTISTVCSQRARSGVHITKNPNFDPISTFSYFHYKSYFCNGNKKKLR